MILERMPAKVASQNIGEAVLIGCWAFGVAVAVGFGFWIGMFLAQAMWPN